MVDFTPRISMRYKDELEFYGSLQSLRALVVMANSAGDANPVSLNQLLKTTAQAQVADLENTLQIPKYQESLSYLTSIKNEFSEGPDLIAHWAPVEQTFRYQANKKEIEFAQAAIESGTTTVSGVAAALHEGWKVIANDFVNNTGNYFIRYQDEILDNLKNVMLNSAATAYGDLPDGRIEKIMYNVMANTIVQAYKDAGIIAP